MFPCSYFVLKQHSDLTGCVHFCDFLCKLLESQLQLLVTATWLLTALLAAVQLR